MLSFKKQNYKKCKINQMISTLSLYDSFSKKKKKTYVNSYEKISDVHFAHFSDKHFSILKVANSVFYSHIH